MLVKNAEDMRLYIGLTYKGGDGTDAQDFMSAAGNLKNKKNTTDLPGEKSLSIHYHLQVR